MKEITNPKTKLLSEGEFLMAKEMEGDAGAFLPKHLASVESVLIIKEGICVMHLEDRHHTLSQGDVFIVPANVMHQIEAKQSFKAFHIMPKDIVFKFFK